MASNSISRSLVPSFLFAICLCFFSAPSPAIALQIAPVPQSPIPGGGYTIAGTVVSKTDGRPLARARVLVQDVKKSQNMVSVITSEDGKFHFSGLPVGKYSLEGAKRGFIAGAYDQHDEFSSAIVTGAGLDTESLVLRLAPAALISGVVLDEVGDPVRQATVIVYHDDHSFGVSSIHEFGSAQTNDLGIYEVTPLLPGTYFLAVRAKPWYAIHWNSRPDRSAPAFDRSFDVAYPTTYYANVTDADSATPIPVRGGDHLQVDLHLTPVPAVSLIFHVAKGTSGGFVMPRLEQPAFDGIVPVDGGTGLFTSTEVFELSGIPAGKYNVLLGAQGSGQGVQVNGVELSSGEQEIDSTAGELLSKVKISLQIPGEPALPPRLAVGLRAKRSVNTAWQLVSAKGEVEIEQVAAGSYEILVANSGKPYAISRSSAVGGEISGRRLSVKPGSACAVALTLVGGSETVQGTAKLASKPFAGAMVVLVPKNPENNRNFFRRDQSDLDGTFSLLNVIPGSYTIIAIEDGWDLDWSQPGVIAAYIKRGRTIEVGSQSGAPMSVEQPIEVQAK